MGAAAAGRSSSGRRDAADNLWVTMDRESLPSWIRRDRANGSLLALGGVAVIVVAVALMYLGGQTSTILSTVGNAVTSPAGGQPGAESSPSNGTATGNGTQGTPAGDGQRVAIVDVARPDLLVVKTGTLDLQVADVPRAVDAATREVEAAGGYLSGSDQFGEGTEVTASATFRIPVEAWDRTLAALRSMAIKVVAIEIRTDDVTAQVVDLRARIANLDVTERALQAIMNQATKIDDVLKIQKELTSIRGEFEEAVARKKHFEDQSAFSSLTVRFGLRPLAAVVATQEEFDPTSEVDRATARLVRILQQGATAAIWFGIVWLPFLIVFGIGALAAVALVRSRRTVGTPRETAA